MFDNVEAARNFVGRGDEPQKIADQMAPAWLAFVRTGNPNGSALPHWLVYEPDSRATTIFNLESQIESGPLSSVREIMQEG